MADTICDHLCNFKIFYTLTNRGWAIKSKPPSSGAAPQFQSGVQILLRAKQVENFWGLPFWGYNCYKERHTESLSTALLQYLTGRDRAILASIS